MDILPPRSLSKYGLSVANPKKTMGFRSQWHICVVIDGEMQTDDAINSDRLRAMGLLKTLSIVEAARGQIPVPCSLLLTELSEHALTEMTARWGLPVMIRVDYTSLPKNKPLGGIPLFSTRAVKQTSRSLFNENCYPLFYLHLDRFKNIVNVGVLIDTSSDRVDIDVMGEGFDASDLRLGEFLPHESIGLDIVTGKLLSRHTITPHRYHLECERRANKMLRLSAYARFVNYKYKLLPVLPISHLNPFPLFKPPPCLPKRFKPISGDHLQSLSKLLVRLIPIIQKTLPPSRRFVASFSFHENYGWLLWDVYGQWYGR